MSRVIRCYKAILGVGFPLHKPYPCHTAYIGEDSFILGT